MEDVDQGLGATLVVRAIICGQFVEVAHGSQRATGSLETSPIFLYTVLTLFYEQRCSDESPPDVKEQDAVSSLPATEPKVDQEAANEVIAIAFKAYMASIGASLLVRCDDPAGD